MTPVTPSSVCDSEREAFEAWALSAGFSRESLHPSILPGQYAWSSIDNRWHAWKARAALAERTQQEAPDWLLTAIMEKFDQLPSWDRSYKSALEHDLRAILAARPTSAANSTAQPSKITPENPVECTTCGGLVVGVAAPTQAPMQPSEPIPSHMILDARDLVPTAKVVTLEFARTLVRPTSAANSTAQPSDAEMEQIADAIWGAQKKRLPMSAAIEFARAVLALAAPTQAPMQPSEREAFEASMKAMEGYPFAGAFANLMWKSWQARAALAAPTQAAPAAAVEPTPASDDAKAALERIVERCNPVPGYSFGIADDVRRIALAAIAASKGGDRG